MTMNWQSAVRSSLEAYANRNSTIQIEREKFLHEELANIVAATESQGQTPSQTVSRVLQELRDEGFLFFSSKGVYTLNQVIVDAVAEDLPDDVLENAIDAGKLAFSEVQTSSGISTGRFRRGMNALRRRTLLNYRGRCALCDIDDDGLLVTSHIARWADRPEARGLLSNTICFCTFHDKLFENGYFAMNHNLDLIWRTPQLIRVIEIWQRQCTVEFCVPKTVQPDLRFIDEHRLRVAL